MKAYLLVIALAVTAACDKKNDVAVLEHEASALVTYYQPKLDAIDKRIDAIMARGAERNPDKTPKIRGDLPGIRELTAQIQEARDTAVKLRGIIGPVAQKPGEKSDEKSPLKAQAEKLAKEGRADQLAKLVHDTELTIDHGMTIIHTNLDAAELWIFNFDNKILALPAVGAAPEAPPAPEQGSAAAPAQGSAAAPAPQQGSAAAPAPQQGSAAAPAPGQAPAAPKK